jgi:hypothetical protein
LRTGNPDRTRRITLADPDGHRDRLGGKFAAQGGQDATGLSVERGGNRLHGKPGGGEEEGSDKSEGHRAFPVSRPNRIGTNSFHFGTFEPVEQTMFFFCSL